MEEISINKKEEEEEMEEISINKKEEVKEVKKDK